MSTPAYTAPITALTDSKATVDDLNNTVGDTIKHFYGKTESYAHDWQVGGYTISSNTYSIVIANTVSIFVPRNAKVRVTAAMSMPHVTTYKYYARVYNNTKLAEPENPNDPTYINPEIQTYTAHPTNEHGFYRLVAYDLPIAEGTYNYRIQTRKDSLAANGTVYNITLFAELA